MDKKITEDVGRMVKAGLTVYAGDGEKVGYVEDASQEQGWMEVGLAEFELRKLWLPYRIVKSIDQHEIFVTPAKDELRDEYRQPPAMHTEVLHREGETIAVTSVPNGYDGEPTVVTEVDLGYIKQQLAVDQRVWTSDGVEVGKIKDFDATSDYMLIEKGTLSGEHDLLLPVKLVGVVYRGAMEVILAVREADLERMEHAMPANVVIDLPAAPGH